MIVELKVPVLAESVAEATLIVWHKDVGDTCQRGEALIDIETDKVTLEVSAPNDCTLIEILKHDGDLVQSEEVIGKIEVSGEATQADETSEAASSDDEATPKNKNLEENASYSEDGQEGLADTGLSAESSEILSQEVPKMGPAVRNLLVEKDIQATDIADYQNKERLTKEDVINHIDNAIESASEEGAEPPQPVDTPSVAVEEQSVASPVATMTEPVELDNASKTTESLSSQPITSGRIGERIEERVRMTSLRKRVAEHLVAAQHESALLTTFNEVNMQAIIALRGRYRETFEKTHGVKLGFMSFFTLAVVEALKKFPIINATVDGDDIVYHGYFDIGIAVSSNRGLVVPIIRDADTLSLATIESSIKEFSHKAQDGKLTIDELTGGTFTITNGGIFGSLMSTPIVNSPQSAILGMHAIKDRAVVENNAVLIRPMMYLALSYDHRIIDGSEAVRFLVSIKDQIEDPSRLMLQI